MSGTEAQKDKFRARSKPDTPASKLRGWVGYLQVIYTANEAESKATKYGSEQQGRHMAGQREDKAEQRGWGNMEGKPKVQAVILRGWGNCREYMQLKRYCKQGSKVMTQATVQAQSRAIIKYSKKKVIAVWRGS